MTPLHWPSKALVTVLNESLGGFASRYGRNSNFHFILCADHPLETIIITENNALHFFNGIVCPSDTIQARLYLQFLLS